LLSLQLGLQPRSPREDQVDFSIHKVCHYAVILCIQYRLVIFNPNILSFDVTKLRQSVLKDLKSFRIRVLGGHVTHDRRWLSRRLRDLEQRHQRQREHSSAQ